MQRLFFSFFRTVHFGNFPEVEQIFGSHVPEPAKAGDEPKLAVGRKRAEGLVQIEFDTCQIHAGDQEGEGS